MIFNQDIFFPYIKGCGNSGTIALPFAVVATGCSISNPGLTDPKLSNVLDIGELKFPVDAPNVDAAPNPLTDDLLGAVATGVGGLSHPLFAAANACFCASLSPGLANMIPLSVPVKNVAIGMINSKNF
jgi:hypothetical protein